MNATGKYLPASVTVEEAQQAADTWGANCGPGAVAAVLGKTLSDVRSVFEAHGFDLRRYTNPTMMYHVLYDLGVRNRDLQHVTTNAWPRLGLVRIQWHGPWMDDGVPIRARYRHTHWVACKQHPEGSSNRMIFDINGACVGWMPYNEWSEQLVPWLIGTMRAHDHLQYRLEWSTTHRLELTLP